jgi:heme/copper-type cytochrome/quinol oxidase subunit 2
MVLSYETNDFLWKPQSFSFDSYMLQVSDISIGERRLLEVDNFLIIPTKVEIRLLITARDVLHSFSLPSLGIKLDACPGRLNANPLTTRIPGTFVGQCSELCDQTMALCQL